MIDIFILKYSLGLSVDTSTKTVGYKEGSGFTHAYNDEPITFNPMEAYQGIRDVRCVMYCKLIQKVNYVPLKFNNL